MFVYYYVVTIKISKNNFVHTFQILPWHVFDVFKNFKNLVDCIHNKMHLN
jgi:hypothetical protein